MEHVDCIVIGAGVIGLAVARALSLKGKEVIVLDKEVSFGMETSSRNSEVIHAGIYYSENSLKAKLCVIGRHMLYDYCQERGISHKKCGKLIVACSEDEVGKLQSIKDKAEKNGVHDLVLLSQEEVLEKEPELNAVAGLFSPSTGIIDSHNFMLSMVGDIENKGGIFVSRSEVMGGKILDDGFILNVKNSDTSEEYSIQANLIINSSGLYAAELLKKMNGFPTQHIPNIYYAKGNYFSLSSQTKFNHLIYPVPEVGGLGIHLTLDMNNQAKFGPNVEWLDSVDIHNLNYDVDENLRDIFYQNIKKYWPAIKKDALSPSYSGIRPKIMPKGHEGDFFIQTEKDHGIKNMINLFGMESPGLTSSLAIAEEINKYISS